MAREGFGTCKQEPAAGRFVSLVRDRKCAIYQPAATDVIKARDAWNEKRSA